jgi:phage portal protein|nr:MAG TPA: portal protein [Caudoviricetes sp.]
MGLFKQKNKSRNTDAPAQTKIELVTTTGNGFYSWNGKLYKSDIITSLIRVKVQAMGKGEIKHIRSNEKEFVVNPDAYIKKLLDKPNPLMSGQKFREKMTWQLMLNNNAFAIIVDDENGIPNEIYPVNCYSAEVKYIDNIMYLKFTLVNGNSLIYPYHKIIHLRRDFNNNDVFGTIQTDILLPLMEIVSVTDQGIKNAILNSNVIQWLLKFKQVLKEADIKKETKRFIDNFLNINSDTPGAAAADAKYDVEQVEYKSYVPNAQQMDRTTQRLYNYYNTNENIVQSKYNEDEWNAYYESEIEPTALDWINEYNIKLFTARMRSFGNEFIFEAANLQYASMATKLNLFQMVDRGSLLPNEWRKILNMGPIAGGDQPIRRLDTARVEEGGEK